MADFNYESDASDGTDSFGDYTFSAMALGTATTDRVIFINICGEDNGTGARTVSTITVAGVSSVYIARATDVEGDRMTAEIWYCDIGTTGGTSDDVVVNWNSDMRGCSVGLYTIDKTTLDDFPTSYLRDTGSHVGTDTVTVDLDVVADGPVMVATGSGGSPAVSTQVGFTQDFHNTWDSAAREHVGGTATPVSDDATYTASQTWTSGQYEVLVAISLNPGGYANKAMGIAGAGKIMGVDSGDVSKFIGA